MRFIFLYLLCLLASSCLPLKQVYVRPPTPVPSSWPEGEAYRFDPSKGMPVRDLAWDQFFKDGRLKKVIEFAIENNKDLKIALLNVERAKETYRLRGSGLFPEIYASATLTEQKDRDTQYALSVGFTSWEIDLFGRLRALKEKALEEFLATEHATRGAQLSLVAAVASAYANLAADKERLNIAQLTYESRRKTYDMIRRRFERGLSSELDLRASESLLKSAAIEVERYLQRAAQDENLLRLLLGRDVSPELLPSDITSLILPEEISPSLSSEILLSRPDILHAEHMLKAAYANVDAARAAFFPRISLTAGMGTASTELSQLFRGGTWAFMPSLLQPLFDAGSRRSNLRVTKIEREIAITAYQKAIETAFKEVADALAEKGVIESQLRARVELLENAEKAYSLAFARYEKGIDNYLSLLEAERSLYSAREGVVSARLAKFLNLVTLYKVLGGSK